MDGNGRWASQRRRPRADGHRAGTENVRSVISRLVERGVLYATLFAFSTENWSRPGEEISALLAILQEVIRSEAQELHRNGVRILHIGRLDRLPDELSREIVNAVELTRDNDRMTLTIAFDYGGRADIVSAIKSIVADGVPPDDIDDRLIARHLSTGSTPDPDLVIRTGGEFRISNFLLWQSAYAEFYSTPVQWPDFDGDEVDRALDAYRHRQRRFGGVEPAD
ncbi:MAG: di-trans,poly-cis-decaprenylcistransferase [Chloroflexi bacterium]|nr:di-trans,poly-cis-decaprenylcistransferase [Chloroflexota bacterium]MCH8236097.1 di-trans,poly-cis-decaprenylcistransferase [Chloroflexota bacterium]